MKKYRNTKKKFNKTLNKRFNKTVNKRMNKTKNKRVKRTRNKRIKRTVRRVKMRGGATLTPRPTLEQIERIVDRVFDAVMNIFGDMRLAADVTLDVRNTLDKGGDENAAIFAGRQVVINKKGFIGAFEYDEELKKTPMITIAGSPMTSAPMREAQMAEAPMATAPMAAAAVNSGMKTSFTPAKLNWKNSAKLAQESSIGNVEQARQNVNRIRREELIEMVQGSGQQSVTKSKFVRFDPRCGETLTEESFAIIGPNSVEILELIVQQAQLIDDDGNPVVITNELKVDVVMATMFQCAGIAMGSHKVLDYAVARSLDDIADASRLSKYQQYKLGRMASHFLCKNPSMPTIPSCYYEKVDMEGTNHLYVRPAAFRLTQQQKSSAKKEKEKGKGKEKEVMEEDNGAEESNKSKGKQPQIYIGKNATVCVVVTTNKETNMTQGFEDEQVSMVNTHFGIIEIDTDFANVISESLTDSHSGKPGPRGHEGISLHNLIQYTSTEEYFKLNKKVLLLKKRIDGSAKWRHLFGDSELQYHSRSMAIPSSRMQIDAVIGILCDYESGAVATPKVLNGISLVTADITCGDGTIYTLTKRVAADLGVYLTTDMVQACMTKEAFKSTEYSGQQLNSYNKLVSDGLVIPLRLVLVTLSTTMSPEIKNSGITSYAQLAYLRGSKSALIKAVRRLVIEENFKELESLTFSIFKSIMDETYPEFSQRYKQLRGHMKSLVVQLVTKPKTQTSTEVHKIIEELSKQGSKCVLLLRAFSHQLYYVFKKARKKFVITPEKLKKRMDEILKIILREDANPNNSDNNRNVGKLIRNSEEETKRARGNSNGTTVNAPPDPKTSSIELYIDRTGLPVFAKKSQGSTKYDWTSVFLSFEETKIVEILLKKSTTSNLETCGVQPFGPQSWLVGSDKISKHKITACVDFQLDDGDLLLPLDHVMAICVIRMCSDSSVIKQMYASVNKDDRVSKQIQQILENALVESQKVFLQELLKNSEEKLPELPDDLLNIKLGLMKELLKTRKGAVNMLNHRYHLSVGSIFVINGKIKMCISEINDKFILAVGYLRQVNETGNDKTYFEFNFENNEVFDETTNSNLIEQILLFTGVQSELEELENPELQKAILNLTNMPHKIQCTTDTRRVVSEEGGESGEVEENAWTDSEEEESGRRAVEAGAVEARAEEEEAEEEMSQNSKNIDDDLKKSLDKLLISINYLKNQLKEGTGNSTTTIKLLRKKQQYMGILDLLHRTRDKDFYLSKLTKQNEEKNGSDDEVTGGPYYPGDPRLPNLVNARGTVVARSGRSISYNEGEGESTMEQVD
jgi:hypothetical protein